MEVKFPEKSKKGFSENARKGHYGMGNKVSKTIEVIVILLAIACGIRAGVTKEVTLGSYIGMTALCILSQLELLLLDFWQDEKRDDE